MIFPLFVLLLYARPATHEHKHQHLKIGIFILCLNFKLDLFLRVTVTKNIDKIAHDIKELEIFLRTLNAWLTIGINLIPIDILVAEETVVFIYEIPCDLLPAGSCAYNTSTAKARANSKQNLFINFNKTLICPRES